jgi:TolA-binding protein
MKSLVNKAPNSTTLAKKTDETTDEANGKKVLLDQENKKPKDQKQIYERGLILIKEAGVLKNIEEKNAKLYESEGEFKQFITNFPNSELISNAYFWYGETFFQRKDYNKAAVQYLKSYKLSKEKNLVKNNKASVSWK